MITILEVAAAFVVAAWVGARVLTELPEPAPPARQYLAGRCDNLQIADVFVCEDELLVTFDTDRTNELTARTWWAANDATSRRRLERWRKEETRLQAYLSTDGGIVLADRRWGGNVACERAMALT
jgi:hypothetical protein